MTHTVLHIDASARFADSVSRALTADIVQRLNADSVIRRDLAQALPLIDETWIGANFTPEDTRTNAQKKTLELSDTLLGELERADTIVIGAPMYNFAIPTTLKAWIDLVARAGRSFRYTEAGPEGLMKGKRAIIALTTGGTPFGSEIDFASGYLRHILGFIGITEVQFVYADKLGIDPEGSIAEAQDAVAKLAA
ncbi:FMN-dependent NADH-azoreductase [Arenibacterium sp. CAU 1754]